MVSVVLIVYRLNSTERKLLGRWVIVSPPARRGVVLECRPYELQADTSPWIWSTNGDTLVISRSEQPRFLARLKQKLGFSSHVEELQILRLEETEMELRDPKGTVPIVYERIGTP